MDVIDASDPLREQIAGVLGELERRWSRLELARIRELWDPDEADMTYIAEELRYPVVGWAAFDEYWVRLSGRLRGARYRTGELRTRAIGPDLAVVTFAVDWELLPVEAAEPNHGQSRVTAVLRQTTGGWRFIHWMEAPIHVTEELWD